MVTQQRQNNRQKTDIIDSEHQMCWSSRPLKMKWHESRRMHLYSCHKAVGPRSQICTLSLPTRRPRLNENMIFSSTRPFERTDEAQSSRIAPPEERGHFCSTQEREESQMFTEKAEKSSRSLSFLAGGSSGAAKTWQHQTQPPHKQAQ